MKLYEVHMANSDTIKIIYAIDDDEYKLGDVVEELFSQETSYWGNENGFFVNINGIKVNCLEIARSQIVSVYEKDWDEEKFEDKNIIKNVNMEIDGTNTSVFISLETLNKIKRGEYEYPFIQCTDGTRNEYFRLDSLTYMSTEDGEYISVDELEKVMLPYIEEKAKFPFKVVIDDNNGF